MEIFYLNKHLFYFFHIFTQPPQKFPFRICIICRECTNNSDVSFVFSSPNPPKLPVPIVHRDPHPPPFPHFLSPSSPPLPPSLIFFHHCPHRSTLPSFSSAFHTLEGKGGRDLPGSKGYRGDPPVLTPSAATNEKGLEARQRLQALK